MMRDSLTRLPAVAAVFVAVIFLFVVLADGVRGQECSRTCIAESCDSFNIRYGKYCGLGYTGCPGEPPCDDLDACCLTHDRCVGLNGMTYVECHEQFKRCVNKLSRNIKNSGGKVVGFSTQCPYSVVIPTTFQGMDYGIFFSRIGKVVEPVTGKIGLEAKVSYAKIDGKVNLNAALGTRAGLHVGLEMKDGLPKASVSLKVDSSNTTLTS